MEQIRLPVALLFIGPPCFAQRQHPQRRSQGTSRFAGRIGRRDQPRQRLPSRRGDEPQCVPEFRFERHACAVSGQGETALDEPVQRTRPPNDRHGGTDQACVADLSWPDRRTAALVPTVFAHISNRVVCSATLPTVADDPMGSPKGNPTRTTSLSPPDIVRPTGRPRPPPGWHPGSGRPRPLAAPDRRNCRSQSGRCARTGLARSA